jgi:predicted ATPase
MVSNKSHEAGLKFKVAVRAQRGRYAFQIFTVAGEPRTFQSNDRTYASPQEAEQAGYEAVAVLTKRLR